MSTVNKQVQQCVASTSSGEQIIFSSVHIHGRQPGPSLAVIAGLHGGEYCGIEAAIQVASLLKPEDLVGEIRIVPVANLPGFMSRTMFTIPQDGKKLSSQFPGQMAGTYTQQLAAMLFHKVIAPSELVIELRGGELTENMAHYVSIQRIADGAYNARAKKLVECFGCRNIILRKPRSMLSENESAYCAATFVGKVGVLAEAGGWGLRKEEDVSFLKTGIMNIMSEIGMLNQAVVSSVNNHIYFESFVDVTSPVEGVFKCNVDVDQHVELGTVLGTVRDFAGDLITEIRAPETGVVLGIVTAAGVTEGVTIVGLGRPMEQNTT